LEIYEIGKVNRKWQKFLKEPLGFKIISFIKNNDSVILREIKKEFAEDNSKVSIEKVLEEALNFGLVKRGKRRYTVETVQDIKSSEIIEAKLLKLRREYKEFPSILFYALISDKLKNISNSPVIVEDGNFLKDLFYVTRCNFGSGGFFYYFVYQPFQDKFSLPLYFEHVADEQELTNFEKEIYDLLGDVNVEYVFKQFNLILLKFLDKPKIFYERHNIFLMTLVKINLLTSLGNNQYQINQKIKIDRKIAKEKQIFLREDFLKIAVKHDLLSIRVQLSKLIVGENLENEIVSQTS